MKIAVYAAFYKILFVLLLLI